MATCWVDDQEYAVGDCVTYKGFQWRALALNVANPPLGKSNEGNAFWEVVAVAEGTTSDTVVLTTPFGQQVLLQIPKKS